jgi:iron complex outermembrane receptor protein
MKTCKFTARFAVLPLAIAAAFPVLAQTQMKEVVISATRFPEATDSLPFGISVITAEEIHNSGVLSINEAVMRLLGVPGRLDLSGGNNYSLDLRGFGVTADSNQVVIVDGLRLNEADQSTAGLSSIPIDSVERIEILRGTGTVLYGEGASGGVIVVTTKAGLGVKRTNAAQLYAATGSYGLKDARASAVIAAGGFSLDVSTNDRQSDGHRVNFASSSSGLNVAGQWSNDWLRLGVHADRSALKSGLPGALTADQYAADPHQADPSRASSLTDFGNSKKENTGVFATAVLGDWQLAADANQRSKKYSSVNNGSPYDYNIDATNYSVRARNDTKFGVYTNALVFGYDSGEWERSNAYGASATASNHALFVKNDITRTDTGTRLSLGLRREDIKKADKGSATESKDMLNAWEFGISQVLMNSLTAYGRVGSSFRLPNVDEFTWTITGVSLAAQTSQDVEIGARWKHAAGYLDLRAYRNDLENEIGFDNVSYKNINFDPTKKQGLELEAKQVVSADMDLRLNAAARQAKFTTGRYAGNDVPLVPKQTVALRANWRPASGHTLDMGVTWVAQQSPDFANTCKMPSYATADLRYGYQYKNAEFAIGVTNLSNLNYYTLAYDCDGSRPTYLYPEAGRSVTASLRVKF